MVVRPRCPAGLLPGLGRPSGRLRLGRFPQLLLERLQAIGQGLGPAPQVAGLASEGIAERIGRLPLRLSCRFGELLLGLAQFFGGRLERQELTFEGGPLQQLQTLFHSLAEIDAALRQLADRLLDALGIELDQRFAQRLELLPQLGCEDALVQRLDLTQPLQHAGIVEPGGLHSLLQIAQRLLYRLRLFEQRGRLLERPARRLGLAELDARRARLLLRPRPGRGLNLGRAFQGSGRLFAFARPLGQTLGALDERVGLGDRALAHLVQRRQAEHVLTALAELRLGRVVPGLDPVVERVAGQEPAPPGVDHAGQGGAVAIGLQGQRLDDRRPRFAPCRHSPADQLGRAQPIVIAQVDHQRVGHRHAEYGIHPRKHDDHRRRAVGDRGEGQRVGPTLQRVTFRAAHLPAPHARAHHERATKLTLAGDRQVQGAIAAVAQRHRL